MKLKRLNNKGFTLIELLAVIVILAVVMGIAGNSVLTSMNNARSGSLQNSADIIARGMSERLVTAQLTSTTGAISGTTLSVGTTGASTISVSFAAEFGLKDTDYIFDSTATSISVTTNQKLGKSFIYYDSNGSFIVCLYAKQGGKYDVAKFRKTDVTLVNLGSNKSIKTNAALMAGCSNGGLNTWS